MIPIQLSSVANHLWQSTIFAGAAVLLTLALRKNRAQMRYWVWLAASVKFLVPFSLLVGVGSLFEWRTARDVAPPLAAAIEPITHPFTSAFTPVATHTATPVFPWAALLVVAWLCGCAVVLRRWYVRWRRPASPPIR